MSSSKIIVHPEEILNRMNRDLKNLKIKLKENQKQYKAFEYKDKIVFESSIKDLYWNADAILDKFQKSKDFIKKYPKTSKVIESEMSEIMSLLKIMIIDAKKITEFNHYVILGGTYSSVTKKISKSKKR